MRRRRATPTPTLRPWLLHLCLFGWDTSEPWPDDDRRIGVWHVADLPALYRAHRADIDAEAARRGLARPWVAELR